MKKIQDVDSALRQFEAAAMARHRALTEGIKKHANKEFDAIQAAAVFLRGHSALPRLQELLDHLEKCVRGAAAAYYLPVDEARAIQVLEEVAHDTSVTGFNAHMTLQEWRKGNLRNFYTL